MFWPPIKLKKQGNTGHGTWARVVCLLGKRVKLLVDRWVIVILGRMAEMSEMRLAAAHCTASCGAEAAVWQAHSLLY